jgi:hypothetical protein
LRSRHFCHDDEISRRKIFPSIPISHDVGGFRLDPFGPRQMGRGNTAGPLAQNGISQIAAFKGDLWAIGRGLFGADREIFSAKVPSRGATPLFHIGCPLEGAAKFINFRPCHVRLPIPS